MYELRVCAVYPEWWRRSYWNNYIKHIQTKRYNYDVSVVDLLYEDLKQIGGSRSLTEGYIDFESEEDATAFVLKWS